MSHVRKPAKSTISSLSLSRRNFMAATGAAVATFAVIKPSLVRGTAANSTLNMGVIGCGGRGIWIAKLFKEHGGYNVAGAYDYFQDRVDDMGNQLGVPQTNRFTGLKGYLKMLDKVDAVAGDHQPAVLPSRAGGCGRRSRQACLPGQTHRGRCPRLPEHRRQRQEGVGQETGLPRRFPDSRGPVLYGSPAPRA